MRCPINCSVDSVSSIVRGRKNETWLLLLFYKMSSVAEKKKTTRPLFYFLYFPPQTWAQASIFRPLNKSGLISRTAEYPQLLLKLMGALGDQNN